MYSERIASVPPSGTVALADKVKAKKRAGETVHDLSVGQPDFPTPPHVVQACKDALDAGATGYGPSLGIPELREAVAQHHTQRRATPVEASNVLVTPAKHALLTFFLTVLDPGDEILLSTPAWVSYGPQARICGARPVEVPTLPTGRLDLDGLAAAITPRTRVLVLNSPSNPTGAVLPPEDVKGALELAQDHDLWLLSDEIYGELVFGDTEAVSPGALQEGLENVAIVDGVSKAYAMTGWRIGWLLGPSELIENAVRIQQHSVTHCTLFAQHGATAALTGDQAPVDRMREAFRERRDLMLKGLSSLDAVHPDPKGAFYLFPTFPGEDDGHDLATRLLEEAGVAVTPGEAFGQAGAGHVRISYAASQETLQAALQGFEQVLG